MQILQNRLVAGGVQYIQEIQPAGRPTPVSSVRTIPSEANSVLLDIPAGRTSQLDTKPEKESDSGSGHRPSGALSVCSHPSLVGETGSRSGSSEWLLLGRPRANRAARCPSISVTRNSSRTVRGSSSDTSSTSATIRWARHRPEVGHTRHPRGVLPRAISRSAADVLNAATPRR